MTDDDLAQAFGELSLRVPEPWELGGVTYHGPDRGWVAFLWNNATGGLGPEGLGDNAIDALANLGTKLNELDSSNYPPDA